MNDIATVLVMGSSLETGMVLVGDRGGHSEIFYTGPSDVMPGMRLVETEHGPLYLDPDESYDVLTP